MCVCPTSSCHSSSHSALLSYPPFLLSAVMGPALESVDRLIWMTRKVGIWVFAYYHATVTLSKSGNSVTATSRQIFKNKNSGNVIQLSHLLNQTKQLKHNNSFFGTTFSVVSLFYHTTSTICSRKSGGRISAGLWQEH